MHLFNVQPETQYWTDSKLKFLKDGMDNRIQKKLGLYCLAHIKRYFIKSIQLDKVCPYKSCLVIQQMWGIKKKVVEKKKIQLWISLTPLVSPRSRFCAWIKILQKPVQKGLNLATMRGVQIFHKSRLIDFIKYTQSVLIRNGPIRSSSEILAFFKKWPVELSKLRNGEITFQIFKKFTSESFQFKKWSRIPVLSNMYQAIF